MKKNFYITTAIDYVNGKPHIGHALEKIQADVIARYQRQAGSDVFFLTGTDEHGVKIVRAASAAKKTTTAFVNENTKAFKQMAKTLDISNDYFIRTSNKKVHWPSVRAVWKRLVKNRDIYKKRYSGLYCFGHEAFVTSKDLKKGICLLHGASPEAVEEENYFFKLSKYTPKILSAIKSGELKIIPVSRQNEIIKLLTIGPGDVSFSRPRKDLKWGIPVPGDTTQTIYVWADALTNYISALGYATRKDSKFKKYWPADVQIIGKDILRFHAAIWPAMLLSLKLPLPKTLFVHGFVSVGGQKMSKSLGNVIAPREIIEKYSADALRYYMLAEIHPTKDGDFSYEKFEARYDGELALGLGNFFARIAGLGERHIEKALAGNLAAQTEEELDRRTKNYKKAMEEFRFNDAIREVNALISYGDRRISAVKLWELAAHQDKSRFNEIMADITTLLANVALLYAPIMPVTSAEIFKRLGVKASQKTTWRFTFNKGEPLFPRLGK